MKESIVVIRADEANLLKTALAAKARWPQKHLLILRRDFTVTKLQTATICNQFSKCLSDFGQWGVAANSGIAYANFAPIDNGNPEKTFSSTVTASSIGDQVVLVHRKIRLKGLPESPGDFFAALAMHSWLQNRTAHIVPVQVEHSDMNLPRDERLLRRYFGDRANNTQIILPGGAIAPDRSTQLKLSDYYKTIIPHVCQKARHALGFHVVIKVTSRDVAALDLVLLSLAAQYHKPKLVSILPYHADDSIKQTVDAYRRLLQIRTLSANATNSEIFSRVEADFVTYAYASDTFYPNYFSDMATALVYSPKQKQYTCTAGVYEIELATPLALIRGQRLTTETHPISACIPANIAPQLLPAFLQHNHDEFFKLLSAAVECYPLPRPVANVISSRRQSWVSYAKYKLVLVLKRNPRLFQLAKRTRNYFRI